MLVSRTTKSKKPHDDDSGSMDILRKFLKNRIKRNRQQKSKKQKSKNRRLVAHSSSSSSSSSSSDNAPCPNSSSSSDPETDTELVPQSEPVKVPDIEPERTVHLVEEVTLDRQLASLPRTHPDSEGDDLSLHASNDELVLAANIGTSTGSKTVNVKVPTAPPKPSLVRFKDAKYKVDLTADPILTMQRCTTRSTRSVPVPKDFVHKLSEISYGVPRLMTCAFFNVNQCSLPSPHVQPDSGLPVRFFHICKLCYVRIGAAMFHTMLDCPLANTNTSG